MTDPAVFPGDVQADGRIRYDAKPAVRAALCRARFAGQRVEVVVQLRKSKRSPAANDALHALLSAWGAARGHFGEALRVWVELMKDDLLGLLWGYTVAQNQLSGEITKRLVKAHTSQLSVEEFADLFDTTVVEAAKDGYLWDGPGPVEARA